MASRRKESEPEYQVNPNAWMFTFSDLVCLLLTFFVMLLTMKSMDVGKVRKTFFQTFGPLEYVGGEKPVEGEAAGGSSMVTTSDGLEEVMDILAGVEAPGSKQSFSTMRDLLAVSQDERGVIVSLESDQLFDSGKARINPARVGALDAVAKIFRHAENNILIMGHTDGTPMTGGEFPSNWELSFHRALNVLYYLRDTGGLDPQHLAAGGFGDTLPLYPNDTDEHRAGNRRVEFILRKPV